MLVSFGKGSVLARMKSHRNLSKSGEQIQSAENGWMRSRSEKNIVNAEHRRRAGSFSGFSLNRLKSEHNLSKIYTLHVSTPSTIPKGSSEEVRNGLPNKFMRNLDLEASTVNTRLLWDIFISLICKLLSFCNSPIITKNKCIQSFANACKTEMHHYINLHFQRKDAK